MSSSVQPMKDRRGRVYTPAIGRGLRPLLWILLGGFALLGANGVYLASVTAVTWATGVTQQTYFYMVMIALHLILGFAIVVPVIVFGFAHLATSWKRPNKAAIRYGLALLVCSLVVLVSGLLLVRIFDAYVVRDPRLRGVSYWLHVITPLLVVALYVKHRLAGPRIRWVYARRLGAAVGVVVVLMGLLHSQEPRRYGVKGPSEGSKYFFPSEAVTATGNFIPAKTLMMDSYCLKCHQDAYKGWYHSSHHFSSFNNKAYLTSVRETRKVSMAHDGTTRGARWCAGCHDPVPFFSGEFDDPKYDDVNNPTGQAGITCTVCHSITNVNSTRGNADYTIEEPQHYPFASSENSVLAWINETLVKAKPEMHKRTFLKPAIKDSKFCSTCHKVGLPYGLNHYKDFLRGQNHYDTFLLSGVSGHGARSFYYPPVAKGQCIECHMNFIPSNDFAAKDFQGKGERSVHDHFFPAANTGLPTLLGEPKIAEIHVNYLKDKKVRVDLFALREGGGIDGELLGPLRPEVPTLKVGKPYLVEVVIRTLGLGHPFSQGTVDSNEIWVELTAKTASGRVIGHSGGIGEDGVVDPYSHFINVYMLDKDGNRIDRRNPQDIFVPLYNKQIPPGAGQIVHFGLDVPEGLKEPITLEAKVNYRKFDQNYMNIIYEKKNQPVLPIIEMAKDLVTFAVEGGPKVENKPSPIAEVWQRWNDYGIGLLLEGEALGSQKGELRQAEPVFRKVVELGFADGWVNLARIYLREGRIPDARQALENAKNHPKLPAPWVVAWLTAQINERNGYLDEAIARYEEVLSTRIPDRKFDFSLDYEVINALGAATYARSRQEPLESLARVEFLHKTVAIYRRTLAIDTENVPAHHNLGIAYANLAAVGSVPHADPPLEGKADAPTIRSLAQAASDPKSPPLDRATAARKLAKTVEAFVTGPRQEFESRLNPLHEVVETLGPAYPVEPDSSTKADLARALAVTHKALHAMFKPDETAVGRAVGIARKNNPAADQNAQSIVIHSLHRPGAPGLPPTTGKVAARENEE
jgi:tetratricopeptide (TPR) repeat protein